jgi:phage-related protein
MSFDFVPDFGAARPRALRVSNIDFGDGYQQRVAKGINTDPQVWQLSFTNRDEDEARQIDEFLADLGGVSSFEWTPPGQDDAIKVVCQEWNVTTVKANLFSISATFKQVFDL